MNYTIISMLAMNIMGAELRTNTQEAVSSNTIGAFWQKVFEQNLLQQIPNKTNSNVVLGVYTDYAPKPNDPIGDYSLIAGAQVNACTDMPQGMVCKTLPAGKYAKFTTAKGPRSIVVYQLWQQIWQTPLDRTFIADFEWYDERSWDPENFEMDIYISIK